MDEITRRARELRSSMTDAEHRLWKAIRGRSLGAKFRRQVPIGNYVADFACLPKKLVLEIDGGQHLDNAQDAARDACSAASDSGSSDSGIMRFSGTWRGSWK